MRIAATVVAATALVAAVWGILHVGWYARNQIVDYGVYQQYGDAIEGGAVPYRDFALEYPPAALPVFVLPSLLSRFKYQHMFQLEMALCLLAIVLAVYLLAGPEAAILAGLAPLALGSVVLSRFDLWPAALVAWALVTLVSRRFTASAVLLGTAFAAKLWPVVLVPFAVVWLVRNHGRRAAAIWTGSTALVAAAWFLPFTALSPGGVGHAFQEQFGRPLQLESLGGAILIGSHLLFGTTLDRIDSYGSQNLVGPGTHLVATLTTVAGALALLAVWIIYVRSDASDTTLLLYCAAAVASVIAFGKVFSPQFLMWLIPLVFFVRTRRAILAWPLFLLTLALTQTWFPHHYWDLAIGFHAQQALELALRDTGVVLLAVVLAWPRRSQHEVFREHRSRIEALQRVRAQVE
jgi:uncharacterized membrane protein